MQKWFTEEQIAFALKRHETGVSAEDICREMDVSEASFYKWKQKYAGMGVTELRKLKALEEENRQLKRLVADLSLDEHMLQGGALKKSLKPARKRGLIAFLCQQFRISRRRSCGLMKLHRLRYHYKSRTADIRPLLMRLKELAGVRPRFGYRRLWLLFRREGWAVNHKRVHRLYKIVGLQLRYKNKKKRPSHARVPLAMPQQLNERWSMDFITDRFENGIRFQKNLMPRHIITA